MGRLRHRANWQVLLAGLVSLLVWPAGAEAAASGSFDDAVGDSVEFAPDLGLTSVAIGDDDTITVDTRIVPRPPAYWGGCAYYVGFPPFQTCIPADMTVTWYLDYAASAGSVADGGADAKVVAIPKQGQTFWEGSRWDAANGRFGAGAAPAAAEDPGGAHWTLRLADLGIPKPATLTVWVVSLYKSYNGLGVLLSYSDTAGPGTVSIPGPTVAPPPPQPQPPPAAPAAAHDEGCQRAIGKVNRLQRKIRATRKRVKKERGKARRQARRKLAHLKQRRRGKLVAMERECAAPIEKQPAPADEQPAPAPSPPATAPPGCELVTKPVLQQEGTGIYATWVYESEVVVVCNK